MRTTLDLDSDIVADAMRLSGEKTKTHLIHHALEDLIRRENFSNLLQFGGKARISFDAAVSRGRK